jgi:hypothetical protein
MTVKWRSKTSWRQKLEKPHSRGKSEYRSSKSEAISPNPGFEFRVSSFEFPTWHGIFLRIVAETAEEDMAAGKKRITPYWRVLKAGGSLNEKYPGGVSRQAGLLKSEGHKVVFVRPGKVRVESYETRLAKL